MASTLYYCNECKKETPHLSPGTESLSPDEHGHLTQPMQCKECTTIIELPIDPKTGPLEPKGD